MYICTYTYSIFAKQTSLNVQARFCTCGQFQNVVLIVAMSCGVANQMFFSNLYGVISLQVKLSDLENLRLCSGQVVDQEIQALSPWTLNAPGVFVQGLRVCDAHGQACPSAQKPRVCKHQRRCVVSVQQCSTDLHTPTSFCLRFAKSYQHDHESRKFAFCCHGRIARGCHQSHQDVFKKFLDLLCHDNMATSNFGARTARAGQLTWAGRKLQAARAKDLQSLQRFGTEERLDSFGLHCGLGSITFRGTVDPKKTFATIC